MGQHTGLQLSGNDCLLLRVLVTHSCRSCLAQLKAQCGVVLSALVVPALDEDLTATLLSAAHQVHQETGKTVLMLVDGLQDIMGAEDALSSLPTQLPPGLLVVVSARSGCAAAQAAQSSGFHRLELGPFCDEERHQHVTSYLKTLYRKTLDPAQVQQALAQPFVTAEMPGGSSD